MNREEAFAIMKSGGYVTHPKLMEIGIGPFSLVGDSVCGKNNLPINAKWKTHIGLEGLSEKSDAEIRRKVNSGMKFGDSAATMARVCMEAEKRGIAWKQSERLAEKKKK